MHPNSVEHVRRSRFVGTVAGYALLALFFSCLPTAALAADLIHTKADMAQRVALADHGVGWAKSSNDRGAVPDALVLDSMALLLKRSPERQLAYDQLLKEQQDPASPNYQKWLTSTEIGQRFGASQHDIDAITGWLKEQGFTVDSVANSRTRIRFSGSAGAVAKTFDTQLHYFKAGRQTRMANIGEPRIPAAFAGAIQSINGLSTIVLTPAHRVREMQTPAAPKSSMQPAATYCPGTGPCVHTVFPADFATIYNLGPVQQQGIDGRGQNIGIIARTRVLDADVTNFQARAALAEKPHVTVIPPSGVDPGPPAATCSDTGTPSCSNPGSAVSDQTEATLDVQRATSVAPGATIKLITSGTKNSADGVFIAMDYAVDADPVPAKILSISYSSCEADNSASAAQAIESWSSQAAMEGISVFVASGDGGVDGCALLDSPPPSAPRVSTNLLCASGYVTCVGGTEFADTVDPSRYWSDNEAAGYGSARSYIPEGAWNEPIGASGATQMAATGGGVSIFLPKPSWQVGIGVPGTQGRYTPDVSLNASTRVGYFTCVAAHGGPCTVSQGSFRFLVSGGTSASAPSMAGIAALLNQKTGSAQANLNPRLYKLATNPANGVFHDVSLSSSGVTNCKSATPSPCNNATPGPNGLTGGLPGFLVGTGYDLPTGLGSIDVANLLAQWDNPAPVAVDMNQHGITGSWANPQTNSQGLLMEVYPDLYSPGLGLLFGGWFTYDTSAAGGQRWYTIQGQVAADAASAAMPIYESTGGRFDSSQPGVLTEVGQGTILFGDCTHGSFAYAFNDGSGRAGTIPLTRLLPNLTCAPNGDNGAAAGSYLWAGTWADPDNSSQGIVLDIAPATGTLFAAWYTFAADATTQSGASGQRWYTLQAILPSGAHAVNDVGIYATTGGVFDHAAATSTVQVGNAQLVFNSCSSATLTYAFTSGENKGAQGVLALSRVGAVPAGCNL